VQLITDIEAMHAFAGTIKDEVSYIVGLWRAETETDGKVVKGRRGRKSIA